MRMFALCSTVVASYGLWGMHPVEAQDRRVVTKPPEELIAAYVRDGEQRNGISEGTLDLIGVVLGIVDYRNSTESVLAGLENIALHGSSSRLRAEATVTLSDAGSKRSPKPRAGSAARLQRLYGKSSDQAVRAAVVAGLARAVERPTALSFLEAVAVRDVQDFPGSSLAAMAAIGAHGEQGSAVLKRLHEAKRIHEPHAVQWLEVIAQDNYRVR